MDDQALGQVEDRAGERKAVGLGLPQKRQQVVEHAQAEQAARHSEVALHRVEVPPPVAAPDGDPGDQVVEDELVQDHDAGALAQGVDDPAVRLRVVADVVERDVRVRRPLPRLRDHHLLEPLPERGQEQLRVVGDPGVGRRQRRVVGDPHESRASMHASQVIFSATALPASPRERASST